jgi:hypothetical protein
LPLYILHRPLPPPSSSSLDAAALSDAAVEEFLVREGELTWWEEAFTVREDEVRISEQAPVQANIALDEERAKVSAARQEYLNKIEAHTARGKQVLNLDKVLVEKKVELDGRERDLELRVVAMVEARAQGLNP